MTFLCRGHVRVGRVAPRAPLNVGETARTARSDAPYLFRIITP